MASAYNFKLTALAGESKVSFHFHFYVGVTYYISLHVGKTTDLSSEPARWSCVSECLILTAVNLIVLIRMAYITKRLVKLRKMYCDI